MSVTRPARVIGTTAVLVAVSLATATAQTQSPPPSPQSPPATTTPQTAPTPAQQATPSPAEKRAAAPADTANLVGLAAKSSDGTDLGKVQSVIMEPSGKSAIGLKVGGFLGFGGHMVAIPDGKFNRIGDAVQVNMTTDEVHRLPQAKTKK